jgi:6-phosphogluconolactonase (cycloisomerase 2 family)
VRFALLAAVMFAGFALMHTSAQASEESGAVYTLSNSSDGNAVLMWERTADGTLSDMQSYDTGGLGTGMGLGSQGAIAFSDDGRWLFAVNAGSNSVSAFAVWPHALSLVGVYNVPGSMPISVASADGLVYVLSAGGNGSIAGFRIGQDGRLAPLSGSVRDLGVSMPGSP